MIFDLAIWLGITLTLSTGVNIFLLWYLRKLLSRFMFVSENLNDLVKVVKNYQTHLKQVYTMDMFHGDETLEYLMSHTRSLLEILEEYEDVYDIAVPIETTTIGELEIEPEPETENPEEEKNFSQPIHQENVFYAGSRGRNS